MLLGVQVLAFPYLDEPGKQGGGTVERRGVADEVQGVSGPPVLAQVVTGQP